MITNTLKIKLVERLNKLKSLKSKKNLKIIFTVGNTRVYDDSNFYLTPIRIVGKYVISGIVLFSENEGKIVFNVIDGLVDYIFVDCEKKSKNNYEGFFNLERLSTELIVKSQLMFYKGNDITTDSIDLFIFSFLKKQNELVGGKNILVIGIGNIGFKVALKLVERGANVFLKSRDKSKSNSISKSINLIKPIETISKASVFNIEIVEKIDIVILTHLRPIEENSDIFEKLKNRSIVLDVGKGCLSKNQINILHSNNVESYRLDIGDVFLNHILSMINNNNEFNLPRRKIIENKFVLIEPGIIGNENEIVVNSIDNPEIIYGKCDGIGGFKTDIDLEKIKTKIFNE
tara:strand:+ start:1956 stop:2990 length:1035 start_codon:yes stop_codon:yes gene_type:complete